MLIVAVDSCHIRIKGFDNTRIDTNHLSLSVAVLCFPLQQFHLKQILPKVKVENGAFAIVNFLVGAIANFDLLQTAMKQMLICNCSFFLDLVFHLQSMQTKLDVIKMNLQAVSEIFFN